MLGPKPPEIATVLFGTNFTTSGILVPKSAVLETLKYARPPILFCNSPKFEYRGSISGNPKDGFTEVRK